MQATSKPRGYTPSVEEVLKTTVPASADAHDWEVLKARIREWARALGFISLIFASVNIFGGFLVTQRMLAMYQKKKK